MYGNKKTCILGCGGETYGKRQFGRPKCRWEDNIKMDLQEVGYGGRGWIDLAHDRDRWRALVNAGMNLRVQ
jgi:hypothetical protein